MNETLVTVATLAVGIILGWLGCHLMNLSRRKAEAERMRADQAQLEQQKALTRGAEVERDHALHRVEELRLDRETMANSYRAMSAEALERQTQVVEQSAEQRSKATEQVMVPMRLSLEKLEARLTEIEKERVGLSSALAEQVRSVQLTGEQLRKETSSLVNALRRPQVRGAWGELQLKRVAELAGMVDHCDFITQESSTTDERAIRPDMRVNLAGGKFVYVDAKTPLEAFLSAQSSETTSDQARHLADFARHVRTHIDQLSSKAYWKADTATPEFVILFLPAEALAATALDQAPDLIEHAATKNVILATPTTLIAMLRAIAYAWNQEVLAQSAKDISQAGRDLYERLAKMGTHFDRLGQSIERSARAYNDAIGSLESRVFPAARRLRDLKVSDEPLTSPTPVTAGVRTIAAAELVSPEVVSPEPVDPARLGGQRPRSRINHERESAITVAPDDTVEL